MVKILLHSLFLICWSVTALKGETSPAWCQSNDIKFQAFEAPIQFSHLTFNCQGTFSVAAVDATNMTDKAVDYYLVLIELFDKAGKYVLTVPLYDVGLETHGETPFPINFSRWLYAHAASTANLKPHASAVLFGYSPSVAFRCPNSARISMVQIRYANAETFNYTLPELSMDPVVAFAPIGDLRLSQLSPAFVTGKLFIRGDGRAILSELNGSSTELLNLIKTQVESWIFSPPLVSGKPAPVELGLLLYVEDVGANGNFTQLPPEYLNRLQKLDAQGFASPLVVIHAYRESQSAKQWVVVAGNTFVNRLDQRQR